jgi:hypothetical protein
METPVHVRNLIGTLNLGNSVAEHDTDLKSHFVETQAFRALVSGDIDVVAGDKGTGKTALFTVLRERQRAYKSLRDVEILPAFNPVGNPIFQRLAQVPILAEGAYVTVWKSYFLSLVGNWLLELVSGTSSAKLERLSSILNDTGLRSADDSANTIFGKVVHLFSKFAKPKSAEIALSITEQGIPVLIPKVEFQSGEPSKQAEPSIIAHEDALRVLDECLAEVGVSVWIVLDRLDEAFQGFPDVERPALRALLRTYLDLLEFKHLRVKLFVRKDLFRKVIDGGFVNLTHVNARRLDIVWDEEDLLSLFCRRVRGNADFVRAIGVEKASDNDLFAAIFPAQIDVGEKKPTTWGWMMSRIRDGNHIKPPRNLIDLVKKAQEAQSRAEERSPRDYAAGISIIEADAVRRALRQLSEDRVTDTLLAEAADLAPAIELFRDGKAEQNIASISKVLGIPEAQVRSAIKPLVELGFLEEIADTFKVPMLYRGGLRITQGKAFAPSEPGDDDN